MWLKLCVAGERTREAEYTRTPHQDVGKNSQLFYFTYTNYQVESCKFGDQVGGSKFLPRKVFPEGSMPP